MRLRRLVLKLMTDQGDHGATLDFPDGLVVLWADNSMGKSTCLKSIMWSLGLEAMLTTSQTDVPLPPAMKVELLSNAGPASVIESEVFLEIQNSKNESIVINRAVKASRDIHLVTVTYGPALTSVGEGFKSEDFFVSRSGSATSDRGFHLFLAKFLGWSIPDVLTFDGRNSPLYLQCIFPYLMVEQTRGWSTLQPPTPTQFRIREIHKRVIEFLLRLDAHRNAEKRQQLQYEEAKLQNEWAGLIREAKIIASNSDSQLQGIPSLPTASWPPKIAPLLLVSHKDSWQPITVVIKEIKDEIRRLSEHEIPRVSEITSSASKELAAEEQLLRDRESLFARIQNAAESERSEAVQIENRLFVIDEDLRRNKDVQTLKRLGSEIAHDIACGECPTCHQRLQGALIPLADIQVIMSIEENVKFLAEQKYTFSASLANSQRVIAARESQLNVIRGEITNLRTRIRSLRQTLVADGRLPSIAAIRNRLEKDELLRKMEVTNDKFGALLSQFADCSKAWNALLAEKASLPKEDVSDSDKAKIERFGKIFTEQLRQFGFKSLQLKDILISEDSYRPENDGFDLPTNISASDFIRVIWAYLNGLLELSRDYDTNHPGLLVFDEPKQQSTKDLSFRELLKRVSSSVKYGQQVIFATSEDRKTLADALNGIEHTYFEIADRIIKRIEK